MTLTLTFGYATVLGLVAAVTISICWALFAWIKFWWFEMPRLLCIDNSRPLQKQKWQNSVWPAALSDLLDYLWLAAILAVILAVPFLIACIAIGSIC